MPFAQSYKISQGAHQYNLKLKNSYTPCPADQLHKIKLGWNIGLTDFRQFPLSKYYLIGTSRLLNSIYKEPKMFNEVKEKKIDSSFRGKINKEVESYSFQRNIIIEYFKSERRFKLVTGPYIPRKKYLRELESSKVSISPFGWGEVCYRDFESIISGCLLLKPDMSHLETYPNIYKKNETYIPLKWDMSDLPEKLSMVIKNYHDYLDLVKKSQERYMNCVSDFGKFLSKFKSLLDG